MSLQLENMIYMFSSLKKGINLLTDSGILNFIIPQKWVNSDFGKGLREFSKKYQKTNFI